MTKKPRVLITPPDGYTRNTFFNEKVKNKFNNYFDISWNNYKRHFTESEITENISDKEACILGWGVPKLSEKILKNSPELKFVAMLGGSLKPYVDNSIFNKDITIVNSSKIMAESVAEAVIAYALAGLRSIPHYNNLVKKEKSWRSDNFYNQGLLYKKVGMVGFGAVGRFLVELLKPFKVDIKVYDPYIDKKDLEDLNCSSVSFHEVIKNSDIISIQAAYTDETHHMFNKEVLAMIPDGTLLINTARGGLIDEKVLIEELKKGRFNAVLDVFEREPLSNTSELRNLDNVILIPHMAGPTIDMRWRMTMSVIDDMIRFFSGKEVKNIISKEKLSIMT